MKHFVVNLCVAFLLTQAYAWEEADEVCVKKLNLERAKMEPLIDKLIHVEDNEDYNKYSECYWNEYHLLDDDKKIMWDKVKVLFTPVADKLTVQEIIKECQEKDLQGKDVGQTVVKVQNCLMHVGIDKGVLRGDD